MKFKIFTYITLLVIAVMSSCSNENELDTTNSEYVSTVHVTVEDFLPETTTRTAYTVDESGFHFQWAEGDALGIYPIGGDQVKFPISSGDGSASASFDGGAWKLRSEYQYAAYYPFSIDNYTVSERNLFVNFHGQTQNGNGSTAHLSKYDYLACAATIPDANGDVTLAMKHLGAFLRLQLTMPEADTYSAVMLESDGVKLVAYGTVDLTAITPVITPSARSEAFTINLTNVATTAKNQMITVYAMVAPADLSTSNIKVTVLGTRQTKYVQTIAGKNFVARSAYNVAVDNFPIKTDGEVNGHDYVDLGLPSGLKWATCNVGATMPEGYGDYFAWGETEPYYTDGHAYDSPCTNWKPEITVGYEYEDYRWCNGNNYNLTKYCSDRNYGTVDNKTVLDPADDAATVNWRGSWRMPTQSDFVELRQKCTWEWFTLNNVNGYKVIGTNGNWIFLPASGYRFGSTLYSGISGAYWSSTQGPRYPYQAYSLFFIANGMQIDPEQGEHRYYGRTIRPVSD